MRIEVYCEADDFDETFDNIISALKLFKGPRVQIIETSKRLLELEGDPMDEFQQGRLDGILSAKGFHFYWKEPWRRRGLSVS